MLTSRQLRFYTYTVDIWRQADSPPAGADFGKYSLLTTGIPTLFISSREADRPSPLGRTKAIEEFSMDRFAFDLTVSIRDTDVVHLTAGPNGSPDIGRWFAVHGNPQRFAQRANRQRVLAKGCPGPGGGIVSGLEDAAYAALVTLIEATYPGLTNVVREEQVERTNWENLLANGSLVPPFAVVRLGPSATESWGLDNQVFRLSVTTTVVVSLTDSNADISGGTDVTAYLLQQLGLLRTALIAYSGGAFQLAGDHPIVNASTRTEANRVLSNLLAGLQAGEIEFGLLVGAAP